MARSPVKGSHPSERGRFDSLERSPPPALVNDLEYTSPWQAAAQVGDRVVRVLDVGGAAGFWLGLESEWSDLRLEITLVNLGAADEDRPLFFLRGGDACNMAYADQSFDVVHSNRVIEHVGQWSAMQRMAREVRRLAPHYFVQTPNFWFPYEPHDKTVLIHWLPEAMRAAMALRKQITEELGWDHFEGRSRTGSCQHALMTMMVCAFLQHRLVQVERKKSLWSSASAQRPSGKRSLAVCIDRNRCSARTAVVRGLCTSGLAKSENEAQLNDKPSEICYEPMPIWISSACCPRGRSSLAWLVNVWGKAGR